MPSCAARDVLEVRKMAATEYKNQPNHLKSISMATNWSRRGHERANRCPRCTTWLERTHVNPVIGCVSTRKFSDKATNARAIKTDQNRTKQVLKRSTRHHIYN